MSKYITKYLKILVMIFSIFCAYHPLAGSASLFDICKMNDNPPSISAMGLPSSGVSGGSPAETNVPIGGNSSSNSTYACCSPNVLKFSSHNNPCPINSSANLCEMTTLPVPVTFSDCPQNGSRARKPIKFQSPAVNCDIYNLYENKSSYPIPFGRTNTTVQSCIAMPNYFGMVMDTITTLGFAVLMMKSFSSATTQHYNSCTGTGPPLEGMFLDLESLLNDTNYCPSYIEKEYCQKILLQGYYIDDSLNGVYNNALGIHNNCQANPLNCAKVLPIGSSSTTYYTTTDPCNSMPNIDRPALDGDGNILTDEYGQTLYCPYTRCNLPTTNIVAQYDDKRFESSILISDFQGKNDYVNLEPGQKQYVGASPLFFKGVGLKGLKSGSKTCISMGFTFGYTTISCKPYPTPLLNWPNWSFSCVSPSCQVGNVNMPAGGNTWGNFQGPATFAPITSKAMQCISETIRSIVQGDKSNSTCNSNLLHFQLKMRNAIKAALILYVIILGLSIAIKGELPKKSEMAIFITKFIFVIWVGMGTFNTGDDNNVTCTGNSWCPTNGLEYLYTASLALMESLPNMIMNATCSPENGENCLCHYPLSLYAEDYSYLALWDALDCRVSYYLGLHSPTGGGKQLLLAGASSTILSGGFFGLLFGLLFSFQIMILLLMLCFTIFLLSFVIFFANIYILCMISVTILVYLGPIFVPLCLFKNTKSNFDSWLVLLLGYSLQPAVVSAFVAVMIILFDNIVYGDCIFAMTTLTESGKPYWEIKCLMGDSGCSCPESCKFTIGYFISTASMGMSMLFTGWPHDHPILFYPNVNAIAGMGEAVITSLWQATLFGYIFYFFSKQLAAFAGDLTNSSDLGKAAISPTAIIDKTGDVIRIAAKAAYAYVTGDASGLKEEGEKVAREGVGQVQSVANKPNASLSEGAVSGLKASVGGGGDDDGGSEGSGGGDGASGMAGTVTDADPAEATPATDDSGAGAGAGAGAGSDARGSTPRSGASSGVSRRAPSSDK